MTQMAEFWVAVAFGVFVLILLDMLFKPGA